MRASEDPKVIYALWRNERTNQNGASPSMRDLTLSWLRFGYQKTVLEAHSIDSLLEQALANSGDICVIQSPGNIISEEWKLPHWNCNDFYQCIEDQSRSSEFLVCADVVDINGHFYIDTQCFIVNLKMYDRLDRPSFGCRVNQEMALTQAILTTLDSRDNQDIEYRLRSRQQRHLVSPASDGWNLVEVALRNNIDVPELPKVLSRKRLSLLDTPNTGRDKNLPNTGKSKFIQSVETQLSQCRNGVFLWNIESYDDIKRDPISPRNNENQIKNLYCVAAGFKPNMLLGRLGYKDDACITFFDYSEQALKVRKKLVEEWDGLDYPRVCREIINDLSADDIYFQLWDGLTPPQINWRDVDQLWINELECWGGSRAFQQHWERQRKLHYRYVLCDLIKDPSTLLRELENSPQSVIWWSNAFFTISSNWILSIKQRKQRFESWIKQLVEQAPDCQIYGADYVNRPINNINAKEYAKRLKAHIAENPSDELMPYKEEAFPLRF